LPVDQIDDLGLLRARRKLITDPSRMRIEKSVPSRQTGSRKASSACCVSTPATACGTACFLDGFVIAAIRPAALIVAAQRSTSREESPKENG